MSIETNETNERFIDPSTVAKSENVHSRLRFHEGLPMFSLVEFNIYGNCNRNCSFCPVSNPDVYERKFEGIDIGLFRKIISDLKDINYAGTILFSAFSEPTLHKELPEIIRMCKESLPNVRVEMVTNGDTTKRNQSKLMSYYEAGIDKINFSLYDGPDQMKYFKEMRAELNLTEDQMNLRRRYFENGNYGMTISNRAGLVDSNEYRDEQELEITSLPLNSPCFYPSYMLLVDYNGDVILCPHDWEKKFKAGNLKDDSIWDVWKGKKFNIARKMLANNNRNFAPCNKCDVKGDVMGRDNFEAWNEYIDQA